MTSTTKSPQTENRGAVPFQSFLWLYIISADGPVPFSITKSRQQSSRAYPSSSSWPFRFENNFHESLSSDVVLQEHLTQLGHVNFVRPILRSVVPRHWIRDPRSLPRLFPSFLRHHTGPRNHCSSPGSRRNPLRCRHSCVSAPA